MKTRKLQYVYAFLTFIGLAIPTSWFVPWLMQHGFDSRLFGRDLFINRISSFFATDLLISAAVNLVFAVTQRHSIRLWRLAAAATVLLGVSVGLPLLLFLRERAIQRHLAQ